MVSTILEPGDRQLAKPRKRPRGWRSLSSSPYATYRAAVISSSVKVMPLVPEYSRRSAS